MTAAAPTIGPENPYVCCFESSLPHKLPAGGQDADRVIADCLSAMVLEPQQWRGQLSRLANRALWTDAPTVLLDLGQTSLLGYLLARNVNGLAGPGQMSVSAGCLWYASAMALELRSAIRPDVLPLRFIEAVLRPVAQGALRLGLALPLGWGLEQALDRAAPLAVPAAAGAVRRIRNTHAAVLGNCVWPGLRSSEVSEGLRLVLAARVSTGSDKLAAAGIERLIDTADLARLEQLAGSLDCRSAQLIVDLLRQQGAAAASAAKFARAVLRVGGPQASVHAMARLWSDCMELAWKCMESNA